jgi:hypothetical protein
MRRILLTGFVAVSLAGCGGGAAENKGGNAAAPGNATATPSANSSAAAPANGAAGTAGASDVALPGGLPLYAGATEVTESGGKVSFKAPASWTDVSQFYVRNAEQAGFKVARGQVGASERLTLTRGGETVHVTGSVVLGGRSQVEVSTGG